MPILDAVGKVPRAYSSTPLRRPLAAHGHMRSRSRVIIINNDIPKIKKSKLNMKYLQEWLLLCSCRQTAAVDEIPPRQSSFQEEDDIEIIDNEDGQSLSDCSTISWTGCMQPTLPGAVSDPVELGRMRMRALPPLKNTKPLRRFGELPPLEIKGTQIQLPSEWTTNPLPELQQPESSKPTKLSKKCRKRARKMAKRAKEEQMRVEKEAKELRKAETAKNETTKPKKAKRHMGFGRSNAIAPADVEGQCPHNKTAVAKKVNISNHRNTEIEKSNAASLSTKISNSPLHQDLPTAVEHRKNLRMFVSDHIPEKTSKKVTWMTDLDKDECSKNIAADIDSADEIEHLCRPASAASDDSSRFTTPDFEPDSSFPELFPPNTPDSVSEQALHIDDDTPVDRCPTSTTFVISFEKHGVSRPTTANRLTKKKRATTMEELIRKQELAEMRRNELHLQRLGKLTAMRQSAQDEALRPSTAYAKKRPRPPTRQQLEDKQEKAKIRRKEMKVQKLEKLKVMRQSQQDDMARPNTATMQQLADKQEKAEIRRKEFEQQKLQKLRKRQQKEKNGLQKFMMSQCELSQKEAATRREQNLGQLRTKCANHNARVARAVKRIKLLADNYSPEPIECDSSYNKEMHSIFESNSEDDVHQSHSNTSLDDDDFWMAL